MTIAHLFRIGLATGLLLLWQLPTAAAAAAEAPREPASRPTPPPAPAPAPTPSQVASRKIRKRPGSAAKDGWHPAVKGALNLSFTHSDGVVGVTDGIGFSLGVRVDAEVTFRRRSHEWSTRLQVVHTQTKSPNMVPFVKSADSLVLQTVYQFRLPTVRWLCVFALWRVSMELFTGELIRPKDATLELRAADGTVTTEELPKETARKLTAPWLPLFHKQFVGWMLLPLDIGQARITLRAGVAAVQVYTGAGWIADDDIQTEDRYELTQLKDYTQAGFELHLGLKGTAVRKILSYELQAELMHPIATNIQTSLQGIALLNLELRLQLGIKIASWLSLNYGLSAVRHPLILTEWQVINNILLAFTASWIR